MRIRYGQFVTFVWGGTTVPQFGDRTIVTLCAHVAGFRRDLDKVHQVVTKRL
jgi:hypothetical protein